MFEIQKIQQIFGITIHPVWPETRFHFVADLNKKRIECGICAIERLWAYAYIYGKLVTASSWPEIKEPSFISLFGWAHQPPERGEIPWPHFATSPRKHPRRADVQFASRLFEGVAGFLLLHEIGHLIKSDSHTTKLIDGMRENHRQEFEADEIAWDFVAFQWATEDASHIRETRTDALVLALSIIAVDRAFCGGALETDTHPRPIDRIDRLVAYLRKWARDDGKLAERAETIAARILYFAAGIVMKFAGIPITENQPPRSPRETITYARKFLETPATIDWDAVFHFAQRSPR